MDSFLAMADVHLEAKLFNSPELAQDLYAAFEQVIDLAIEKKVSYVVVVGDLYDNNRPRPDTIKFVKNQLNRLRQAGITPVGIAGDHDKPVNSASWVYLSGFCDMSTCSKFLGVDYSDEPADVIQAIKDWPEKEKVEWIFLHGQVPELFHFCEEKKLLDLKKLELHLMFPNLKGILLGDIHIPVEGHYADPTLARKEEIYIGYCGSLGIVRRDEINKKFGLPYWDGKELLRLPVQLPRQYYSLDIAEITKEDNKLVDTYHETFKACDKKPLVVVNYDRFSEALLPAVTKFYDVALVRTVRVKKEQGKEEAVNIRSELATGDRIVDVLRECLTDTELYDLTLKLLKEEDPKLILDLFREENL